MYVHISNSPSLESVYRWITNNGHNCARGVTVQNQITESMKWSLYHG